MGLKLKDYNRSLLGLRGSLSTRAGAGAGMGDVPFLEFIKAFKQTVVTGGGTDTNLTAAGVAIGDQIIGAIQIDTEAQSPGEGGAVDLTSEVTITDVETVQFSTTDTTGTQIILTYIDLHS